MADYRKMWEDLGMDVETHDQLCAVLPQAFGDVFLSQENRPEGMDYYNMVVADIHGIRPAELIEHQKKGGKVFGTFRMKSYLLQMQLLPDFAEVLSSGFRVERKCSRPIPVR